jgi:sensor histidine kinase YesM
LHLLFWIVSINSWNIVFNPGVETTAAIKGLQDYWPELLLLHLGFYLYLLLPFVWMIKGAKCWLKISLTFVFVLPIVWLIFDNLLKMTLNEDLEWFTDLFLSGFMYVVVFHLTIACAVYFNLYVLVDRYLKVSRFIRYLISVAGLTILSAVVNVVLFDYGIDQIFPNLYFVSYYQVWELVLIIAAYLVFTTGLFLVWQYAAMLIANRDKAQNELSALKAQINPHFLFNNLNTIYSLASKNDDRTKEVILQLSDFLRYVLYDTSSAYIPLEKEVEIIRTYVELQKARINPEITQVELMVKGSFDGKEISPLLLLPLAENCFKHGVGKGFGIIRLSISVTGKQLLFTTENSVALRERSGETEQGGIGIANVEKRLNLLYPNRHTIHFEEKEGVFRVAMRIEL